MRNKSRITAYVFNKDKNSAMNYFFFFLAPKPSSSAASLARFSLTPTSLALALFILRVWNADCFFSSSVITLAVVSDHTCLIGMMGPVSCVATSNSAAVLSPFFGLDACENGTYVTLYCREEGQHNYTI